MSRLTLDLINLVNKQTLKAYESVYIDIDGGIYATNAPYDLVIDGNTYISLGAFLGFGQIEETRLFTASQVNIVLAGIPQFETGDNFLTQILEHNYIDKEVKIYRSFFDSANNYVNSFLMFKGRIDSPVVEDDPSDTTTVAVTATNNWGDYERTNGMITNSNRQQSLYPGDLGFEHANETIKDIKWLG